jgi:O-methyltransferase involved in polyketide biosynthesis
MPMPMLWQMLMLSPVDICTSQAGCVLARIETMTTNGERLDGVSATTLWTLRNRAVEARRPDAVIDDPWAIRLYETISYDYDRFGKPSQTHPLRALAIDRAIADFLAGHSNVAVVALGEGLQTSYWRLGSPDVDWLSVDLAPVIELRKALLPTESRITSLAMSALDRAWMDRVDPASDVFISVEGLFMYLDRADVLSLITDCARRFPGGRLFFDSIPRWFSDRTLRGRDGTSLGRAARSSAKARPAAPGPWLLPRRHGLRVVSTDRRSTRRLLCRYAPLW